MDKWSIPWKDILCLAREGSGGDVLEQAGESAGPNKCTCLLTNAP